MESPEGSQENLIKVDADKSPSKEMEIVDENDFSTKGVGTNNDSLNID